MARYYVPYLYTLVEPELARVGRESTTRGRDGRANKLRAAGNVLGAEPAAARPRMCSDVFVRSPALRPQWLEKYRPQVISDIVGNEETVGRLQVLAQQGNMPNLILSGPPGTGKTTSVLALARTLLGDAFKEGVLELNASDDRGIEVVRGRIKAFAQKKVTLPPGKHKIIILDEADAMTDGAQQAMRRTMEIYSSTTRFALACNLSEKIIEPIQSRCAVLRYSKLTDGQVLKRLQEVLHMENAPFNEQVSRSNGTSQPSLFQALCSPRRLTSRPLDPGPPCRGSRRLSSRRRATCGKPSTTPKRRKRASASSPQKTSSRWPSPRLPQP